MFCAQIQGLDPRGWKISWSRLGGSNFEAYNGMDHGTEKLSCVFFPQKNNIYNHHSLLRKSSKVLDSFVKLEILT